jgi:hypothetical protein
MIIASSSNDLLHYYESSHHRLQPRHFLPHFLKRHTSEYIADFTMQIEYIYKLITNTNYTGSFHHFPVFVAQFCFRIIFRSVCTLLNSSSSIRVLEEPPKKNVPSFQFALYHLMLSNACCHRRCPTG